MAMIKKIRIKNFKSFKDTEVELGNFNVLIGANASGKSNFVQVFQFLKDITLHGFDNAISMQGVEYLKNMNAEAGEDVKLSVTIEKDIDFSSLFFGNFRVNEINYELFIKYGEKKTVIERIRDKFTLKCDLYNLNKENELELEAKGKLIVQLKNGVPIADLKVDNKSIKKEDYFHDYPFLRDLPKSNEKLKLLLGNNIISLLLLDAHFRDISIFDIEPKRAKESSKARGKVDLEGNGENLSIVLKKLLRDPESKRKLFNLLKYLLPFVENMEVDNFSDKSLLFKLKEEYNDENYIPASLISDGTINVIALIIALFFDERPFTIIEEPERNIHPSLMSRVVDVMKDASKKKQLLITTHNPEIVKYVGLENILLLSRDKEGNSVITRPANNKDLKTFLENEIGIEELYVQNLMEV